MLYGEPQEAGTWVWDVLGSNSLYFCLKGHEDSDVPTFWLPCFLVFHESSWHAAYQPGCRSLRLRVRFSEWGFPETPISLN